MKTVLLLGRTGVVVEEAERAISMPGVRLLGGTGLDNVRAAFAQSSIDHVIMGAGIDLDERLKIVQEVFQTSDTTTVHMKDRASGKETFLPFARSVLDGLQRYQK